MKKLISVCMALMLVLACVPLHASAEGSPTFAAGTAEAYPGHTVEIPVLIENNPGIIAFRITVSFDTSVLTLTKATPVPLFSEGTMTLGGSYETATYNILWENGTGSSNMTGNGTIVTLEFLVDENAPIGDTAVSVSYDTRSTFDYDLNEVAFETRAGAVTVVQAEVGSWSFSEDCTLFTFESEICGTKFVAGLDITYPVISDYVETTGGWTFEVELNDVDMESTGAKLVIYDADGNVVDEFWSVMFGDINGDGVFDGMDQTYLVYAMNTMLDEPWADFATTDESPQAFAADTNHDFVLDGMDLSAIVYQISNREDIEQTFDL